MHKVRNGRVARNDSSRALEINKMDWFDLFACYMQWYENKWNLSREKCITFAQ